MMRTRIHGLIPEPIRIRFAICQQHTVHIILQTPWLYGSYEASCLYLVVIFSWGTWNGASYYIEVFSEQYKLQFLKVPTPR